MSLDADPFAVTSRPVAVTVNGRRRRRVGRVAATVTERVVVAVAPPLSVTVSVTVYVPAAA